MGNGLMIFGAFSLGVGIERGLPPPGGGTPFWFWLAIGVTASIFGFVWNGLSERR